jgi:hypothetical protein
MAIVLLPGYTLDILQMFLELPRKQLGLKVRSAFARQRAAPLADFEVIENRR